MNSKTCSDQSQHWEKSFSKLRKPGLTWNIASAITVSSVGLISKLYISLLNHCHFINTDNFNKILDNKPSHVPLITISNHVSCFDDPGLWGTLKASLLTSRQRMRWSLAANDICFTNKLHGYFFLLGKSIPIVRGNGVYQAAMDFCIERLGKGEWVHIFPEGKINLTKDFVRIKWGLGRLIYDSPVTPIVIPIWHVGMDQALPNQEPYILTLGNNLTFNFGKPIEVNDLVETLREKNVVVPMAHKAICDKVQSELMKLKIQTIMKHNDHYGNEE